MTSVGDHSAAAWRFRVRAAVSCLAVLLVVALGACGYGSSRIRSPYPLYSPNGEMLSGGPLGSPSCSDALSRWFARVDADHDGTIDRGEFLADARAQFAIMDLDHDGVIVPAELAAYRASFPAPGTDDVDPRARRSSDGSRPEAGGGGLVRSRDDGRGLIGDRADPVMIADIGLRNKVSLADFMAHAERRFAALDLDHDGRLTRAELLRSCGS